MSATTVNQTQRGFVQKAKRFAPVVAILAAVAGAFALGVDDYLNFDALRENREVLMSFTQNNVIAAAALFITVYALATALSLPGGAVLSIAGGFLFGSILGTAWVVLGATIGAVGIFLAARTALGDFLKAKAGPWLKKMEAGFQDNALSYLLVLRLVPLFPFVVVNLVPAFLGVKLRIFVLATFVGIIPGSFVFASIGAGLGSVFDRGDSFSPANALTPEVIVALVGLSVLSVIPVAYKKIKARRAAA